MPAAKCPYWQFPWHVFSRISTEYGEIPSIRSECRKIRPEKLRIHSVLVLDEPAVCT